jgi:hypothetical protein
LKDFLSKEYNSSPRFYEGERFEYDLVAWWVGWKAIYYKPQAQYWFFLSLFHECAHAVYHRAERAILSKYENNNLWQFVREKHSWERALEMLDLFKKRYRLDLLSEFKSQKEIYTYINNRRSTYLIYEIAQQAKELYLVLQEEKVA